MGAQPEQIQPDQSPERKKVMVQLSGFISPRTLQMKVRKI